MQDAATEILEYFNWLHRPPPAASAGTSATAVAGSVHGREE
jgi:hypothetical protein